MATFLSRKMATYFGMPYYGNLFVMINVLTEWQEKSTLIVSEYSKCPVIDEQLPGSLVDSKLLKRHG